MGLLSASEAARELGVSVETLYAYVSRGLIRSEPMAPGSRARAYRLEDIRAFQERKARRRDPERIAEGSLHWGAPVLESRLSQITGERLGYRGHDVARLAEESRFEDVATLLWTGSLGPFPDDVLRLAEGRMDRLRSFTRDFPPFERLSMFLTAGSAADRQAWDLTPEAITRTGGRIVRFVAAAIAETKPSPAAVADVLQRAWAPKNASLASLLDAALILCADHELNVSTFTARCVASAGSPPWAAVLAGLAALRGFRHAGATEQVEGLFDEARAVGARRTLEARLRRGERIPGFGHPLYPGGDPRAALLLEKMSRSSPRSRRAGLALRIAEEVRALKGVEPNVDFAVVALCRAYGLPGGAPFSLFAVARCAGWIAHAIEQYEDPRLVRPRARYVGEPLSP